MHSVSLKFLVGILSFSDYSPFGMQMVGRNASTGDYRYAFNGMEHDPEVSGDGNSYTTEFRAYDSRLGRWKILDPLMAKFPGSSPYVGFANSPIYFVDADGREPVPAWVAMFLDKIYPGLSNALTSSSTGNFSHQKLYDWVNGDMNYVAGKKPIKGALGEFIFMNINKTSWFLMDWEGEWTLQPSFGTTDVGLYTDSDNLTHVSLSTSVGPSFMDNIGNSLSSPLANLVVHYNKAVTMEWSDRFGNVDESDSWYYGHGTYQFVFEVKTLAVTDNSWNASNILNSIERGVQQTKNHMEAARNSGDADYVVGALVLDYDAYMKVYNSSYLYQASLLDAIDDLRAAGGQLMLNRGSSDVNAPITQQNLNAASEKLMDAIYKGIKQLTK